MTGKEINLIYKNYIDTGQDKDLLKIAKSYKGYIVNKSKISDDLYCDNETALSYAMFALTEAIARYDNTKDCSFSTYLHWWEIAQAKEARKFLQHSISEVCMSRYIDNNSPEDEVHYLEENFSMDYELESNNFEEDVYKKYIDGEIDPHTLEYFANEYLDQDEIDKLKLFYNTDKPSKSLKLEILDILSSLKEEINKY